MKLPTDFGDFDLHLYRSKIDDKHHVALVRGDVAGQKNILVRVHSECLTGDVFGSRRCDCGPQLQQAMKQVAEAGRGVIVYMRQEGRGIGLGNKIRAYEKESGKVVWETELPAGATGSIITYLHNGKQYIVVASGGAEDCELIAFTLSGPLGR